MFCTKDYLLDAAVERKGKNISNGAVEDWNLETLKIKNPEQYNTPEAFDIVAYKECIGKTDAIISLLNGSFVNKWDYEEDSYTQP